MQTTGDGTRKQGGKFSDHESLLPTICAAICVKLSRRMEDDANSKVLLRKKLDHCAFQAVLPEVGLGVLRLLRDSAKLITWVSWYSMLDMLL